MDYKTSILINELSVDDPVLPEINGLFWGQLNEDTAVFDYTRYFEENKIEPIDHKAFMRVNKHFIKTLIEVSGKKTSDLFFQNTNGHILVTAELAFLFLAFANPDLCQYFNNLIYEALSNGVAYSTGFIYSMAAQKLPDEVMQDIIKDRKDDTDRPE